jgi:hypothetical protein
MDVDDRSTMMDVDDRSTITDVDDRSTTMDMDVKRSRGDGCERKNGAQRSFFVNVIARSVDLCMLDNRE